MLQGRLKMFPVVVSLSLQYKRLLSCRLPIAVHFLVLHIFSPQNDEMMLSSAMKDFMENKIYFMNVLTKSLF